MDKIKVAFEVQDSWKNGGFREFIQSLLKDERFDVYIISNDDISAYILSIGEILRIPNEKVIVVNFTQDKIQTINDLQIDIYLENLKYVADEIENTTDCYGIYVDELPSQFYVRPKYIVAFERVIEELKRENCAEGTPKEE